MWLETRGLTFGFVLHYSLRSETRSFTELGARLLLLQLGQQTPGVLFPFLQHWGYEFDVVLSYCICRI